MLNQSCDFADQLSQLSTEMQSKDQNEENEQFLGNSVAVMRTYEAARDRLRILLGLEPLPPNNEPTTQQQTDLINAALLEQINELDHFRREMSNQFYPPYKDVNLIVKSTSSIIIDQAPNNQNVGMPVPIQFQIRQDANQSSQSSYQSLPVRLQTITEVSNEESEQSNQQMNDEALSSQSSKSQLSKVGSSNSSKGQASKDSMFCSSHHSWGCCCKP